MLLGWDGLGGAGGILDAGVRLGRLAGWPGLRDDAGLGGSGRVLDAGFALDSVLFFLRLLDLLIGNLCGPLGLDLLLGEEALIGCLLLGGADWRGGCRRGGLQGDGGDGRGGRGGGGAATGMAAAGPDGSGGCGGGLSGCSLRGWGLGGGVGGEEQRADEESSGEQAGERAGAASRPGHIRVLSRLGCVGMARGCRWG